MLLMFVFLFCRSLVDQFFFIFYNLADVFSDLSLSEVVDIFVCSDISSFHFPMDFRIIT